MSDEAFTITLEGKGEGADKLQKLYQQGLPAGFHEKIAQAGAELVRGHLQRLDSTRANVLGGKRSHFYWNAAQTVRGIPTVAGAEITINHLGLRQRWLGGDIYPVNARKLAIPARSESYGIPPKEFPGDLTVITFRSGAMALVKDEQTHSVDDAGNYTTRSAAKGQRKSRKKTIGLVEYWLVDSVHQAPDPTVLPSPEELLNAVTEAASEYLATME
jgi:hypothetical protein